MAFDFPNAPTTNQTVTMPDGTQRVWDGTKWRQAGLAPGPYLPLSGGSLTGPLVLAADPTSAMQAATKEYVDAEALNNTGRNLVHNGLFTVQQRSTGPWTTGATYTADRWMTGALVNDTISVSIAALADADRTAIGDEQAQSALQIVFTGSATSGSMDVFIQRMEGVRRFSGKLVAVSFWARASSGTPKIGVSIGQNFGSGGSPSAGTTTTLGATAALSNTWVRYAMGTTLPSAAGKTFGTTANTDFTVLQFWFSDQANSSGTGIGVQSGTVQLWGVQLELGTVATPLAKRDPADEIALCQRFYAIGTAVLNAYTAAGSGFGYAVYMPVTMRANPTVTLANAGSTNLSGLNISNIDARTFTAYGTGVAAGQAALSVTYTASADL